MKISDNQQGEGLPSRERVENELNVRARNPEMEQGLPRTRTPFGSGKLRLGVTKIPGYHLHWIADYPGRLEEAQDNGYEFVTQGEVKLSRDNDSAGERVSRISGSHDSGKPLTLHLMKIRDDWYEENQEYYLARARRTEQQIRKGMIDGVRHTENYIPKGGRIGIDSKLE
jgi:hypothetical protein